MKKWLLSFLAALLFFAFILPLFLPNKYSVERSIVINKSRDDVYSKIINLEAWPEWSPWNAMDPEAEYQVVGPEGVVGTFSTWKGEKIGSGKQTLTQLVDPELVVFAIEFHETQQGLAQSSFTLSETENGTNVTWAIQGELTYPLERYFGLMMDSMLGKEFEKGLSSLKANLEQ